MKASEITRITQEALPTHDDDLTAKEWIDFAGKVAMLAIEEMHKAPCPHNAEFDYVTPSGKYCGTCQRRISPPQATTESEARWQPV